MQLLARGSGLHGHFLVILGRGFANRQGRLRRFPAGQLLHDQTDISLQAVVAILSIELADSRSALEGHGSETRYKRCHPIQPIWSAQSLDAVTTAYIKLHLVARDLKVDVVQLEKSLVDMAQYL